MEGVNTMNEHTLKLLEECNAGCKMAVDSMDQALGYTKDENLKTLLQLYKEKHERLEEETSELLHEAGHEEKEPGIMASAFAWITAETKLMWDDDNNQIAKLMMNGANMGIQSVTEYRHKYHEADEKVQSIAKKLVRVEEEFLQELKRFL